MSALAVNGSDGVQAAVSHEKKRGGVQIVAFLLEREEGVLHVDTARHTANGGIAVITNTQDEINRTRNGVLDRRVLRKLIKFGFENIDTKEKGGNTHAYSLKAVARCE